MHMEVGRPGARGSHVRPTRLSLALLALLWLPTLAGCEAPVSGDSRPPGGQSTAGAAAETGTPVQQRRLTGSFPLASAGFSRGDPSARLTIYEISDFGCRFCGVFAREELPVLHREFVESGRVRWVFIPTEGASANGAEAARAAVCAGEQERFWEMHDRLFADQRAWMRPRDPAPVLRALALASGIEAESFDRCYESDHARERLRSSSRLSLLLGIRATPSFFVDGRIVEGALRAPQFADLIRRTERVAAEAES